MKARGLILFFAAACVREMPEVPRGPTDASAPSTPVSSGSGVLLAGFDADSIAPAPAPGGHDHHHGPSEPGQATSYTCPHHPDVVSDAPGKCPKCGMALEPKKPAPSAPHDHGEP